MGSLYESYMEMLRLAKEFGDKHEITVTGINFKASDTGLVIPKIIIENFGHKLWEADAILEQQMKKIEEEKRLKETAESMLTTVTGVSVLETPEPVKSSESDESAFYFPFGRD